YQPVENFEYRGFTHKTSVTTERNWLAIKEAENGLYNVDLHYTRGIYELNTLEGVHRIDPVVHTILPGVSLDQAIAELQAFEERYKASGIGKPEREYTHNVMGGKGKLTIKHAQGTVNFSKSWRPSSHWSHFLRVATPATPA
ncbi:MAG: hypothetical protein HY053_08480, partial [Proteobacteria bacterium]|nr:hypothetical protein [Pseudomonadota bacterium]